MSNDKIIISLYQCDTKYATTFIVIQYDPAYFPQDRAHAVQENVLEVTFRNSIREYREYHFVSEVSLKKSSECTLQHHCVHLYFVRVTFIHRKSLLLLIHNGIFYRGGSICYATYNIQSICGVYMYEYTIVTKYLILDFLSVFL